MSAAVRSAPVGFVPRSSRARRCWPYVRCWPCSTVQMLAARHCKLREKTQKSGLPAGQATAELALNNRAAIGRTRAPRQSSNTVTAILAVGRSPVAMSVAQLARTGVLDQPVASTSYAVHSSTRRPAAGRRGAAWRPRATAVRDCNPAVSSALLVLGALRIFSHLMLPTYCNRSTACCRRRPRRRLPPLAALAWALPLGPTSPS